MMDKQALGNKIKQLEGLTNDEKSALLELLNSQKKYGLVWEDKPEEVEEQLREKIPILTEMKERAILNDTERDKHPNHILIEGDNLHALTSLCYTHEGKVDVIYIDPPYNTGNKDFVYNDSFVDSEDSFRHSKWLSFMERRLKLAKRLLSEEGVIIVSIGYHEIHNLNLLCKEMFDDKQVVSITLQTSGGKPSSGFNYLHEYLVFIVPQDFNPNPIAFSGGKSRSPFEGLTLSTFNKTLRPNQAYPIFIDKNTANIVGVGDSLAVRIKKGYFSGDLSDFEYDYTEAYEGVDIIWPITSKGHECVWRLISSRLLNDWEKGYIKVSINKSNDSPNKYSIQYLPDGVIKKISDGTLSVVGTEFMCPTLLFGENQTVGGDIPTIWTEKLFYTTKGTVLLRELLDTNKFSYPKPLDLILEVIKTVSSTKSLILDFFAGSGTTLHATMQLNATDGGHRQCILVTNNENNICEEVTYERNKRVINGYTTPKGVEVKGLSDNNLRYYRTNFIERRQTQRNKRQLVVAATDLLCIKENIYAEQAQFGSLVLKSQEARYFAEKGKQMLILYKEEMIDDFVEQIERLNFEGKLKIYVFAPGEYPYTDDFEEVLDKVELCALPDAIYKAYKQVLPAMKEAVVETHAVETDELDNDHWEISE